MTTDIIMPLYDIAISGAGPVGSALALLLAERAPHPERIAVLARGITAKGGEAKETGQTRPAARRTADPRTLALNHGSRMLLEKIGAWPGKSVEITTVHVSQRSRLGRTLIRHDELGVPRLGNVAAYDDVLACLHAALRQCGVTLLEAPAGGSSGHNALHGRAELPDTDSKLFVRSDGARATGIERQYGQDALLATVRASRPRAGWAYERFTRQGPLAFLPHPDGADLYGVVWCNPPARAAHLQALDDAAFEASLGEAFGDRLGDLHVLGPRHVFPLSMHAGPSLLGQRAIAIGNAAQTLHPVAGQGMNLGLRDAAQLAIALGPWLAQPDSDPTHLLADFARRRRPDRLLTGGVTDFLPRIFATGNPLVEHAGGLALLALDVLPGLRRPLARHLLQGLRT
jgi:2-octaprenyl-6-methoxyphenol hydroxylase